MLSLLLLLLSAHSFSAVVGRPQESDHVTNFADCDSTTQCINIRHCIPAMRDLHQTIGKPNYKECGWKGYETFVCCPKDAPDHSAKNSDLNVKFTTPSRSKLECERYVKTSNSSGKVSYQISNGEDAVEDEFPHMAALGYPNEQNGSLEFRCGGTLISEEYVLTAAHCLLRGGPPTMVRLGTITLVGDNVKANDYEIENLIIHQNFSKRLNANDIALIKLKKPVEFSAKVSPACLQHDQSNPTDTLFITGWGVTELEGPTSNILQKASVRAVDNEGCKQMYETEINYSEEKSIKPTHICAGVLEKKVDTCKGDSGGPLQQLAKNSRGIYTVVGVTSFGRTCGGTFPGVYTRVANYIDWIESHVWPK